ncbi:MAG: GNAT family N-acetyltransferase [Croceibacterium sp.]
MADAVIATPRLVIRQWRDDDLQLWLEHLNTPEVKAHLGGVQLSETVAERLAKAKQAWADDGFAFLAVELIQSGRFLGTVGIGRIANDGVPAALSDALQVGWQLRQDAWGHGYATEAASAMLSWGFATLGLPGVYAQTSESNPASWRIMKKLGMERLPELDYDAPDYPPEDNPTMIYGLTREKWQRTA